ncbi:uroporphyrinogen-III C-methyltransferase [Hippea jasoniae]|uniref:uroporphyrinogen-III C-methyltransferase n=1 Tax=Hippea jasoniae TaxID=944479 RepID=UPI000691C76C|nr:uroporphyrinogen-III C-methyltransferase [Hippea jasoniae]
MSGQGKLFIISAPPVFDLISLRAIKALKQCDVILYDRLVNRQIVDLFDKEKIFVGKAPHRHSINQKEINMLIEKFLKKGKTVGRLKGGDAAVFSRVSEEINIAYSLNAEVEWISGTTAAFIFSSFLKVPLTSRGVSDAVVFITGHPKQGGSIEEVYDWKAIVDLKATVVVYMGVENLETIAALLLKHGMKKEMPVAVGVDLGGRNHRVVFSSLSKVSEIKDKIESPAVIIIGEVLKDVR